MKKFIYKNKETGEKIYSDKKLSGENLVLISQIKDGLIKSEKVIQK